MKLYSPVWCLLRTTPFKKWARHPTHPSYWTHPYPHLYKGQACPPLRERASKRICRLFSSPTPHHHPPTAATRAPVKSWLNFLSDLQSISIDWGRSRTLVGNKMATQRRKWLSGEERIPWQKRWTVSRILKNAPTFTNTNKRKRHLVKGDSICKIMEV